MYHSNLRRRCGAWERFASRLSAETNSDPLPLAMMMEASRRHLGGGGGGEGAVEMVTAPSLCRCVAGLLRQTL